MRGANCWGFAMGVDVVITFNQSKVSPERRTRILGDMRHLCNDTAIELKTTDEASIASVWTMWRYYGPGYERGNLPAIYTCLRYLLAQTDITELRYGGDTYEVYEPVTREDVEALMDHYLAHGHRPYRNHGESTTPCPECGYDTWSNGRANGEDMYICMACNWSTWKKVTPPNNRDVPDDPEPFDGLSPDDGGGLAADSFPDELPPFIRNRSQP